MARLSPIHDRQDRGGNTEHQIVLSQSGRQQTDHRLSTRPVRRRKNAPGHLRIRRDPPVFAVQCPRRESLPDHRKGRSNGRRAAGACLNFLHAASVGDTLLLQPPTGDFVVSKSTTHPVCIGGGIGITPLVSMLLNAINEGKNLENLVFIQCCQDSSHHAMHDELRALSNEHRFRVSHCLRARRRRRPSRIPQRGRTGKVVARPAQRTGVHVRPDCIHVGPEHTFAAPRLHRRPVALRDIWPAGTVWVAPTARTLFHCCRRMQRFMGLARGQQRARQARVLVGHRHGRDVVMSAANNLPSQVPTRSARVFASCTSARPP